MLERLQLQVHTYTVTVLARRGRRYIGRRYRRRGLFARVVDRAHDLAQLAALSGCDVYVTIGRSGITEWEGAYPAGARKTRPCFPRLTQ